MKLIEKNNITNIKNTNSFDNIFMFPKSAWFWNSSDSDIQIIYIKDLLKQKKNNDIEEKLKQKPAMYSNMYSAKDELEIFEELFQNALKNKQKIHIVWITLAEELKILETYYEELWFKREDINCFRPDFSIPLVTVSLNIENLIWKGSDYKAQRENIFFLPPIRESSHNKALFKWINRGVVAGIHMQNFWSSEHEFLTQCITQEKILPLTLGKVLYYNLEDIWIVWKREKEEIEIKY